MLKNTYEYHVKNKYPAVNHYRLSIFALLYILYNERYFLAIYFCKKNIYLIKLTKIQIKLNKINNKNK